MFERRLKIVLGIMLFVSMILLMRSAQIQIVQHDKWKKDAAESMRRYQYVETTRGRILDRNGQELAVDMACTDAAVDYRAIGDSADLEWNKIKEKWIVEKARQRLSTRAGEHYTKADRATRAKMLSDECAAVRDDINRMWTVLGRLSGKTPEEISEIRQSIIHKVEMRRRYIWYENYSRALKKFEARPEPSLWKKLLLNDTQDMPQLDEFSVDVAEQFQAHVILPDVDATIVNALGKDLLDYPGLVLRPSVHRVYPFGDLACHLLGRISKVTREDLENDPWGAAAQDDDRRQYLPNDLIGRTGVEALAEPTLRGTRGKLTRIVGEDAPVENLTPTAGKDVRLSIDIDIQRQVQDAFRKCKISYQDRTVEYTEMHGAAVLLNLADNQVLAMVSNPTYDLNHFDDLFPKLLDDQINNPLLNRATQFALEPGSIVKPMVGIGAISQGAFNLDQTVECRGFLVLHGRKYTVGRCWTQRMFNLPGHVIPWSDPHPTGFLTFSDALQRSCNVFFETLADDLGADGLTHWYKQFGLGSYTGIGISEVKGRLPEDYHGPESERQVNTWFAGIGQGSMAATPMQMADVAATIARGGVWMRPSLLRDPQTEIDKRMIKTDRPDVMTLPLNPGAVAMAKDGMIRVVNTDGGTGKELHRDDVVVAAKTGTPQAARLSVAVRDENGNYVRDADGNITRRFLVPGTQGNPSPEAPWYRAFGTEGKTLAHAWVIGFAPADHPKVAFAVMVEYGYSGGVSAASVANKMLDACIEKGYIPTSSTAKVISKSE